MFKDKKKMEEELRKYGLYEDKHYYIEKIFLLTTYFEAMSIIKVSESDYENNDYDAWSKAEIQDKLHEEKDVIGFQLLDQDFKPTTFEKLLANKHIVDTPRNVCGICGARVIPDKIREKDKRLKDGVIRCFDHIGVPMEAKGLGQ